MLLFVPKRTVLSTLALQPKHVTIVFSVLFYHYLPGVVEAILLLNDNRAFDVDDVDSILWIIVIIIKQMSCMKQHHNDNELWRWDE
jgi:hypothetical protein